MSGKKCYRNNGFIKPLLIIIRRIYYDKNILLEEYIIRRIILLEEYIVLLRDARA